MSEDGLDFVVAGLPRSGTTAFSTALNVQSNVFCHGETGLFDVLHRYAGACPLPKNKIPYLREELANTLKFQFIENPRIFGRSRGRIEAAIRRHTGDARPVFVKYTEGEVRRMVEDLTAIVESGLHGQALFRQASSILAASFRRKAGKRLVGEKTPNNVFCLSMLRAMARCFLTVREPFAAIRSMTVRGSGDGPGDGAFSPEFSTSLGQYLHYLRQVRRVADCRVIRYEDLVTAPEKVVAETLEEIGSPADESEQSAVRAVIHRHSFKTADELGFTPTQQSIVAAVLREDLNAFGYPLTFRPAPVEAEQIIKLFGFNVAPNNGVFGRNAAIFVISGRHHRRLAIGLWSQFPILEKVDLVIRIDGKPAEKITVGARATQTSVEVELGDHGHEFDDGHTGHLVEFEPSFWYRPVSIDRFGSDTQEWSFMITSIDWR